MPHLRRALSRLSIVKAIDENSVNQSTNEDMAVPRRGVVFTLRERLHLLDTIADELPVTSVAWDRVAEIHSERYDVERRTGESLKQKFNELCRKPAPTGDPNIPEDVRLAKHIRQIIVRSVNASTGDNKDEDDDFPSDNEGMDFDMAVAVPGLGAVPANNAPPAIVPAIPLQVQAQIEANENVLAFLGANAAMAVAVMNGGAPANVAAINQ